MLIEKQLSLFDTLDMPFGKMSQEPCQPEQPMVEKEQPSRLSLPNSSVQRKDAVKPPLCLYLKTDGHTQELSYLPMDQQALPGESSTFNFSVAPNVGNASLYCAITMDFLPQVSSLSNILESNVDEMFHLSAKACQGILTRAERRGKKLPEPLRKALMDTLERQ